MLYAYVLKFFKCLYLKSHLSQSIKGWLGEAKMSYILHHWGIQLILAYSWARLAILAAGKGREGMFYDPNFKEVGGAYCVWVFCPSVRLFVTLFDA